MSHIRPGRRESGDGLPDLPTLFRQWEASPSVELWQYINRAVLTANAVHWPEVLLALKSDDDELRVLGARAALCIGEPYTPAVVEAMLSMTDSRDQLCVSLAMDFIEKLGATYRPQAAKALRAVLGNGRNWVGVRYRAARMLIHMQGGWWKYIKGEASLFHDR